MSTKFEQLLDLIVNEESEKAQELFHAIVVEKSREIYETLIAEEAEEEMDESADEEEMDESADEEEMDESADEEEMDESMDLEDSYSMEADDEDPMSGSGDATDKFGSDIGGDEMDGEEDPESQEDNAIMDIKTAIQELEAAFAELEQAQGGEASHSDFGSDEEPGMDDEDNGMMIGKPAFEGRRITREYTEKVGNDWEGNSQKTQAQHAGAGTGDKEGAPVEGQSPINRKADSEKPTSTANAKNIGQGYHEGQKDTGTSPNKVNNGIAKTAGEKFASGNGNVPGGKMGIKNLKQVGEYGKGEQTSPKGLNVGARTGQNDNQGETNTKSVVDRKF
jgi:hypothetical protein